MANSNLLTTAFALWAAVDVVRLSSDPSLQVALSGAKATDDCGMNAVESSEWMRTVMEAWVIRNVHDGIVARFACGVHEVERHCVRNRA